MLVSYSAACTIRLESEVSNMELSNDTLNHFRVHWNSWWLVKMTIFVLRLPQFTN